MSVTDEVKARLDLVNYIGNYVPLKKAGHNYKGVCPFHSENTPSFVVFPESQTWHCFGACGDGGDVFNFAMKYEGWDFKQALTALAGQAGVELAVPNPQQVAARETQERLRTTLAAAADFFQDALHNSPQAEQARVYVEERGLTWDTAQKYGLGYAFDAWDVLQQSLLTQGYDLQDLIDAGLLSERKSGGTYDRFRDRLMIPIRDASGDIVGFGARALKPETQPKYLNSPQTALFDKSHLLFGLSEARRAIRESQTATIVEGYMDVMQAQQAGFENVVAQMGTALTEHQLKAVRRYASRLILALDADTAGMQATMRGLDAARATLSRAAQADFDARGMIVYESHLDAEIRVLLLPEGTDPDDLIRQSPDEWQRLAEESMPVAEYAILMATQGRNLDDPKVKKAVVSEVIPIIDDIADPVERDHYQQYVARLLKINERVLMVGSAAAALPARVRSRRASPQPTLAETQVEQWPDPMDRVTSPREAFCVAALIHQPNILHKADRILKQIGLWPERGEWNVLSVHDFVNTEHGAIFTVWREALTQIDREPIDYLYTKLDDTLRVRLDVLLEGYSSRKIHPDAEIAQTRTLRDLLTMRNHRIEEYIKFAQVLSLDGELADDEQKVTTKPLVDASAKLGRILASLTLAGRHATSRLQSSQIL